MSFDDRLPDLVYFDGEISDHDEHYDIEVYNEATEEWVTHENGELPLDRHPARIIWKNHLDHDKFIYRVVKKTTSTYVSVMEWSKES